jgi:hypothetical protein
MKFAYFNPLMLAVEDVTADVFTEIKSMVNTAHEKSNLNDEGNPAISIRGGQQIQLVPNQFNLNTDTLKKYIEQKCQEYIDNLVRVQGINDLNGYSPILVSAWTIKQKSGDYQALHNHEAHISGNIYVDVPDLDPNSKSSDANIEFRFPVIRNPAHFIFTDQWRFKPQPLKMIMFPSYVSHTVYPWKGHGERTILAWDVKLVSKITK